MILTPDEARIAIKDLSATESEVNDLIRASEQAIEDYIRYPLSDFEMIPYPLKLAAKFYCASQHEYAMGWEKTFHNMCYPYRHLPTDVN